MKLKRELGMLDVFCIASGAMISSGLFILPGIAHARAGPAVVASYLLAALFALTGMLSQVNEYGVDHRRVFDTGDDADGVSEFDRRRYGFPSQRPSPSGPSTIPLPQQ